uniref:60S ribosomal protein L7 n=1 Tax=Strombidium rassoulzadegani TaxID=1082188 RepID=A0A7S3FY45_9SPIT|mmetsp:Transcript_9148/g.15412  ORF Transcript_9148/g.15412 Transcript_9148/m.15412 type:complete len:245 (+) Transcript_9148:56-790(+)
MAKKGTRVVPENILKKQARDAKLLKALKDSRTAAKKTRAEARKVASANAEKYFAEYQKADLDLVKAKRDAKAKGSFFVEGEPKIAFVVRIRGINKLAPKPKKILQLLRLRQIHNGVFVKLNKATWNMIRVIEPFVTYGYPSRETIRKLIYKRGYGKVNRARIPLTDNSIISDTLGKTGIACVEDLIHEIATCGPKFKEANNFLWPFKLSSPLGGFEVKRHSFNQGYGAFGNREELINALVKKML